MNAPGPFYVVNGCCTACGVPFAEAPGLFAYDDVNHCFVTQQPASKQEHDQVVRAAWGAELQCIRYRGNDPQMLRRFAELGEPHLCDVSPPSEVLPVVRDLVTFETNSPQHAGMSAHDLAEAYRKDVKRQLQPIHQVRFMPMSGGENVASLTYAWFKDSYHTVEFRVTNEVEYRWLIRHYSASVAGGRGVSLQIDDWLKGEQHFCHIRWFAAEQWPDADRWQSSPL